MNTACFTSAKDRTTPAAVATGSYNRSSVLLSVLSLAEVLLGVEEEEDPILDMERGELSVVFRFWILDMLMNHELR